MGLRLATVALPFASVLAFASACGAPTPPPASPSPESQPASSPAPTGTSEANLAVASARAPAPSAGPASTTAAPTGSPSSAPAPPADVPSRAVDPAEDAAMRLGAAWSTCDRAAGRALSLTYEEASALTTKKVDRNDWDAEQRDAFDQRCRELSEAHARVLAAKVTRTEHHDPQSDSELKAGLDIAFVQYVFEQNGQASMRGGPVMFVKTRTGFKFIARH